MFVVQPLDLGIIQNTKVYYCKYFLKYALLKVEECTSATEVGKSMDGAISYMVDK